MAIIKGAIQMTGGIKGVSFYTLPGSDKVIMRTKGGPSARRLKVGPEFEKMRRHQSEWSACVKFSRGIRFALGETYRLADHNVSSEWNGMGKKLLGLDREHPVGERVLQLSKYRRVLENFSLNRNYQFNAVLRVFPAFRLDRDTLQATVNFPSINAPVDLLNIQRLPYFRLIVSLGVVSDILCHPGDESERYQPTLEEYNGTSASATSTWFSTRDTIDEQSMTVSLPGEIAALMTPEVTCLVGIGIEFGNVGFAGEVEAVKRAGCSKVMAVG